MKELIIAAMMIVLIWGAVGLDAMAKSENQENEQENLGQNKGARIVLLEKEVTLFDENGNSNKKYVVEYKESSRLFDEVEKKVFAELKVKNINEVSRKRLGRELNEGLAKKIRIKNLQEPELKFLDEEGKEIKKIKLSEPFVGWSPIKKLSAVVSANGKAAALVSRNYSENTGGIRLSIYNNKGVMLYEKSYDTDIPGGSTPELAIADNGVCAVLVSIMEGESTILYVYGKTGEQIIAFPEEAEPEVESEFSSPRDVAAISSNGRYLAVDIWKIYEHTTTHFFDTVKKTWWASGGLYRVISIDDEGLADVINVPLPPGGGNTGRKRQKLDLKR